MGSPINNILLQKKLKNLIKDVPNFPKEGILFKDITPILLNGLVFKELTTSLAESLPNQTTHLMAIESRGFIFASAIAHHLGIGMVLVRKPGKLPREKISHSYQLEYGSDTLEIHKEDLTVNDKVVIIDDVLATGGTASAAESLCKKAGAELLGHRFIMELSFLNGRSKLNSQVESVLIY
jgi:adenine phosphoribosyltransferase